MDPSFEKSLIRDLKHTARAVGITDGAAELFITAALPNILKSLEKKSIITDADLSRILARELAKYDSDFAYIYKIHDIII